MNGEARHGAMLRGDDDVLFDHGRGPSGGQLARCGGSLPSRYQHISSRSPSASRTTRPAVRPAKWVPIDQHRLARQPAEDGAAGRLGLGRIGIGGGIPMRPGELAGVVGDVAGDEGFLSRRGDMNAAMPGRMAEARHQPDLLAELVVGLDQLMQPGLHDRLHGIRHDRRLGVVAGLARPVLEFPPAEQVAGAREGGSPDAIHQPGVPADMVGDADGCRARCRCCPAGSGGRQVFEEAALPVVPVRDAAALLVVAEAGIDQDAAAAGRLDDQGMDAEPQPAGLVGEVRHQPVDPANLLGGGLGQQEAAAAGRLQLDELGDGDLPDGPAHAVLPLATPGHCSGRSAAASSAQPRPTTPVMPLWEGGSLAGKLSSLSSSTIWSDALASASLAWRQCSAARPSGRPSASHRK